MCARTDGDVAPAQVSGEGFYAHDTRYLSEVRLGVGGAAPVALSYAAVDDHAVLDSTNATLARDRVARLAIDWVMQHVSESAPIDGTHRVALV